jgi:DNA-3-methyladenine glycosylase I
LKDPGIIRNRLKVEGTVKNAKAFIKVQQEHGSFDKFIWQFTEGKTIVNKRNSQRIFQPIAKSLTP